MERVILHSDLNCFYAAVEINENPTLRGQKVAVCGSTENRHGIVLTASYPAKRSGVKTGMANWQAQLTCPGLICVSPHYDLYLRYSAIVRDIYHRYTDVVEPFGMDECWLDLGLLQNGTADGLQIAEEIRQTIKEETGLTVSIGVSFSKVFAKLGSDLKKPDAITVINRNNFKNIIWGLSASELLYVGPTTTRKLASLNIKTIGDLANCNPALLRMKFGKNGVMLWSFARGSDHSAVQPADYVAPIKSVGHGTTCVVDLETEYEVWRVLYELSQDVSHRLLKYKKQATGVQITVKDKDLAYRQYQMPLPFATQDAFEIASTGFSLFQQQYGWIKPVRALTIRGINLEPDDLPQQIDLFNNFEARERRRNLAICIDEIRRRFGNQSICAACLLGDLKMAQDRCETVLMPSIMYR